MTDLSILCSGVRTENWAAYCNAFFQSKRPESIEIICVGPNELPAELQNEPRLRYIQDKGTPTRGLQIAAKEALGTRIMWVGDDALLVEGAQDQIWDILDEHGHDRKTIVLGKYTEGPNLKMKPHPAMLNKKRSWDFMMTDTYYKLHGSECTSSPHFPREWCIANHAYIDKSYFIELGGLDCRFEAGALATADWAARAQRDGAQFILAPFKVFHLGFEGARGGTHAPVYDGFVQNDLPLYKSIYNSPDCVNRTKIDFDNWKNSPEVWSRRWS